MKFLLKIIFAPIIAVLAVVTWFFAFLLSLSAAVFGIAGGILGFFGVVMLFADSVKTAVSCWCLRSLSAPTVYPCWRLGCWASSNG